MPNRNVAESFVQYGIQAANSKTILMVTEDPEEADRMLDLLGEGRLITRTISYTHWGPVDAKVPVRG